jgi:hypothetical protein
VLVSSVVDRGFIGGVMVSVLVSSVVDRGFIGDVMVSVLASSVVDRGFIIDVMVSVAVSLVLTFYWWRNRNARKKPPTLLNMKSYRS